jgi:hypothetical protein
LAGAAKPEKIETGAPTEQPAAPKQRKKSAVSIDGMKLTGATIEFRDAKQQPIIVASGVDVNFTKVGQDGTEGQATITRLAWLTRYVFENVSTPFHYAGGALDLGNIQAVTLGGNIRGTLQMNAEAAESPFTVHMDCTGSVSTTCSHSPVDGRDISGKLSGQVDAKGTSKNFQRLEGPGRLTIEEGRFTRLPLLDPIAEVLEIPELSDLRTSDAFVDFKLRDEKAFCGVARSRDAESAVEREGGVPL